MGLFDTIAGETKRNFIVRPDSAKGDIVWKHPDHNIRMLTQLTLAADEQVLFLKSGIKEGVLGPGGGPYTLSTANLPFLGNFLDKLTGGNIFIAELYFINAGLEVQEKFGGELGQLTDPVTGLMCEAMVYGDMTVTVTNAEILIKKLAGTDPAKHTGNKFLSIFKSKILAHLSDAVGELGEKNGWSLNKVLSPHYKLELSEALIEQLKPVLTDKYGISVASFGNFKISIAKEDMDKLNEKNTAIADDQRRMQMAQNPAFMAVAQAEMMRNAGKGMAKGGEGAGMAMGGLGMGMGMGMAQNFNQNMNQQQHQQQQPTQQQAQQVKCQSCGNMSPPGKFCSSCGKGLAAAGGNCTGCGQGLAPGAKFCAGCGTPAQAAGPKKCSDCSTELAPGAKFCPNCGKAG